MFPATCRVYDTEKDTLAFTAVDKFLPDEVYYHGCLKSFLQITKWRGPEVGVLKSEPPKLLIYLYVFTQLKIPHMFAHVKW